MNLPPPAAAYAQGTNFEIEPGTLLYTADQLIAAVLAERERFIFQGGSEFARSLAGTIERDTLLLHQALVMLKKLRYRSLTDEPDTLIAAIEARLKERG